MITLQAISEEDRRQWLDAMDGREPVSWNASFLLKFLSSTGWNTKFSARRICILGNFIWFVKELWCQIFLIRFSWQEFRFLFLSLSKNEDFLAYGCFSFFYLFFLFLSFKERFLTVIISCTLLSYLFNRLYST